MTRISRAVFTVACGTSGLLIAVSKIDNGSNDSSSSKPKLSSFSSSWMSKFKASCASSWSTNVPPKSSAQAWDWNWDKRAASTSEEEPKEKPKRSLKHYLFIRHGQYNMNGFDDSERYLTQLGREQAELTGKRLAKLNLNYTKIVQSSMTRAKETCGIVSSYLPELPVETSDLLREGAPIRPDPPNRLNESELKYFSDAPRIESAFRKFVYRPKPNSSTGKEPVEIYVCHANVIRYFLCRVVQLPPQGWLRMSLKHGSITWVTVFSDGDVCIRSIGDAGYMPPSKLSS